MHTDSRDYLAALDDELVAREQEAYKILAALYSEPQLVSLCRRADEILRHKGLPNFAKLPPKGFNDFVRRTFNGITLDYKGAKRKARSLDEHSFYATTFYATMAAVHFRDLQMRLPPSGVAVPVEDLARFALDVSIATLCLTEAGWKAAERFAKLGKQAVDVKRTAGENSHGMTKKDRERRNQIIQDEINRLCLEKNHSYNSACLIAGGKVQTLCKEEGINANNLSKGQIKKITTNPRP